MDRENRVVTKSARSWHTHAFQAYLIVATVTFGLLAAFASRVSYFSLDVVITRAVQSVNAPWIAQLMWAVSIIGYAPQFDLLIAAIAIVLLVIGLRWEALTALVAAGGSAALAELVKMLVHRPRPAADLVGVAQQFNGYSFPSGHVLTYTAFFGFLFFLGYTLLKPSFVRMVVLTILGALVTLIGISRIFVGGHWASDVIGAYLLGSLWLTLSTAIYQWLRNPTPS